jgi:hypothetical protein
MLLRCWELKEPINKFIKKWRGEVPDEDDAEILGNKALSTIITEDEWD